ncbi:MAG: hypothetical protein JNK64_35480 [Myxococcales bacterium]|nr:hypothetical protein [Myxococcales bacterium]
MGAAHHVGDTARRPAPAPSGAPPSRDAAVQAAGGAGLEVEAPVAEGGAVAADGGPRIPVGAVDVAGGLGEALHGEGYVVHAAEAAQQDRGGRERADAGDGAQRVARVGVGRGGQERLAQRGDAAHDGRELRGLVGVDAGGLPRGGVEPDQRAEAGPRAQGVATDVDGQAERGQDLLPHPAGLGDGPPLHQDRVDRDVGQRAEPHLVQAVERVDDRRERRGVAGGGPVEAVELVVEAEQLAGAVGDPRGVVGVDVGVGQRDGGAGAGGDPHRHRAGAQRHRGGDAVVVDQVVALTRGEAAHERQRLGQGEGGADGDELVHGTTLPRPRVSLLSGIDIGRSTDHPATEAPSPRSARGAGAVGSGAVSEPADGKSAKKPRALRKARFATDADLEIKGAYGPADVAGVDVARDLGQPGQYPYTRGVQDTMYRGQFWTMRQYAGFGTAAESNRRYKYLLAQGGKGLSVAFDLPTQMGKDSDHPTAAGEVGRVGVAIDSLEDMRVLFDGIPLGEVSTSMTINATAATLLALYVAVGDEQGVARSQLRGTIQNDVLKEYIARGTYIYPPRPSMRLITDTFTYCAREVPQWNTVSISGYHIREAGADAVQEVAFTLADGMAYVEAAIAAGLAVDDFAPRLSFFFNGHNNFLEEIAKFRAARRMWARIMREQFGAQNPKSWQLRFHTQTAGVTLQAQQPLVNIARVTIQALAAVLGGTQSLHTNSFDEALGLPTEEAARIALRTQQVIAHESGVADFIDALGGSYAIEHLTSAIEAGAQAYLASIAEQGGVIAAIERGYQQREIERRAYEHQRAVERKDRIVVGVNEFTLDVDPPVPVATIDPALERDQVARLAALRGRRNAAEHARALTTLDDAARGTGNLVEPIVGAVKALATVGEIADALRRVFGEYQPTRTL